MLTGSYKASFNSSRATYGYRRIYDDLCEQNEPYGKHRIACVMRENGITPKPKRRYKVTIDSRHNKPIHANHLNRQFSASAPNQRWTSDITYIDTNEGWFYLAVIMDLFSRKIVGWSMSNRLQEALVINAFGMAIKHRRVADGLLLHSDCGSQYAANNFQQLLRSNGVTCSMSRKGNCWDNAAMESFFHSLKTECIYRKRCQTREEAKILVFDYIEVFYNRQRKHSFLGYKSPEQFEMLARQL